MLLHFLVASVQAGPRSKTIELGLRFSSQFNQDLAASDHALAAFCFPLGAEAQAPKEYMASDEYTFTLTKSDGSRFSGFCRRFLPPAPKQGPKLRYPKVICLITEAPWFVFFSKVLQTLEQLVKDSELLDARDLKELPTSCSACQFLRELSDCLDTTPQLGTSVRLRLPPDEARSAVSPPKRGSSPGPSTCSPETFLDLQVPPDCGNGPWNAGVSMARLLYHVPIPAMLTLISSMLLERRIILVGQSRDMVSAAVHAANAFLYPFRWHHIFLPLLPKHFKDYLTAPMPFLVGMPAQLLPLLKGIPMNEVTMIDLDLAKCEPTPGSRNDDALLLPWRDRLELALHTAYSQLRSPTEYESNPLITGIMQEYFLKLLGNYRKFVTEVDPAEQPKPGTRRKDDHAVYGEGMKFDHEGFVASFRGLERAKNFLHMFRHSQMYEVFIQERLQLARKNYVTEDIFECKVLLTMERRSRVQEMSSRVQARYNKTINKLGSMMRKHTRNASSDTSSLDFSAGSTIPRGLPRVHTDPSGLDRITTSGASTPASAPPHGRFNPLDLHQLFESESDAESDISAFSNPWGRASDSGASDLDRASVGPARADSTLSTTSIDPDNLQWRGAAGASSTATTPKPVHVPSLISLDEDHPPGSRPPDSRGTQSPAVPTLTQPPRHNPFAPSTPPPRPLYTQSSPYHGASSSKPQQPSAAARFMSILDAALSTAGDPRQAGARPPPVPSQPLHPTSTAAGSHQQREYRVSRDQTFGSLLASVGKDAWSELAAVARDVRESVREARENLKGTYGQMRSPESTVTRQSFSNLASESSEAPAAAASSQLPDQKLVDDFLTSSMQSMGLSPGPKPGASQLGPTLQQLKSQSSLDAMVGAQAAANAELHRTFSNSSQAQVLPIEPGSHIATSTSYVQPQAAVPVLEWDPFSELSAAVSPPTSSAPSPVPTALASPPAAAFPAPALPGTCAHSAVVNSAEWKPFQDQLSSTGTNTAAAPALAPTPVAHAACRASSTQAAHSSLGSQQSLPSMHSPQASFTAFQSAALAATIAPLPPPAGFSGHAGDPRTSHLSKNTSQPLAIPAPSIIDDDPFAMLAASARPSANSSPSMGHTAGLVGVPLVPVPSLNTGLETLI